MAVLASSDPVHEHMRHELVDGEAGLGKTVRGGSLTGGCTEPSYRKVSERKYGAVTGVGDEERKTNATFSHSL